MYTQAGGLTDVEKENSRLREATRNLRQDLEEGEVTKKDLERRRRQLEDETLTLEREKAELQASLNVSEEKLRIYESLSTTSSDKVMENIKVKFMKIALY